MWRLRTIMLLLLKYCVDQGQGTSDINVPVGHLLPLGQQRPPSVPIDEFTLDTAPHPEAFYQQYVKTSKPAIFREAMKHTPAFKLWTDDFIKSQYGNLEVRLQTKIEKANHVPIGETYLGRDNLRHFVETYHEGNSSTYIVSELPKQMYRDIGVLPSLGVCGEMGKTFVEIDLWWSGGDTKSDLHKDAYNQVNCLYRGTKYWKLYEEKYGKWLHLKHIPELQISGVSYIDVDQVDLVNFPNISKIPWSNITINPGDCIFLPKDYYHQVNSDGPNNLAVSVMFSRLDTKTSVNTDDCQDDTNYTKIRALDEFDVMWQWEGKGVMSMGFGDLEEDYRGPLLNATVEINNEDEIVTVSALKEMLQDAYDGKLFVTESVTKAFAILDRDGDGELTVDEIQTASSDQLREFARATEPYEPSNSYTYEYSYANYWKVLGLLQTILENKSEFSREYWTEKYTTQLRGTKQLANEIFTKLIQSEEAQLLITKNVNETDINRALENWIQYWTIELSPTPQRPVKSNTNGNSYNSFSDHVTSSDEEESEFTTHHKSSSRLSGKEEL